MLCKHEVVGSIPSGSTTPARRAGVVDPDGLLVLRFLALRAARARLAPLVLPLGNAERVSAKNRFVPMDCRMAGLAGVFDLSS